MRLVWKVTPLVAALAPAAARAGEELPEPTIIPLAAMTVPIFTIVGGTAVLIVAILMANRTARVRQETIQLAIKEGRELPPELFMRMRHPRRDRDPLLAGLVLTALGVAVSISVGAICGAVQAVWGLIPLLVGVALLIYVPFWRKQKKEEEDR
jgi:protein-S-isoprenylcysteine O-methyltransferase Ste14